MENELNLKPATEPTAQFKPQRIIQLSISNVKRVSAVEVFPGLHSFVVGGQNEQGKSSVLDSILYAFGGKGVICEQPIKEGSTKAQVVVKTNDLTITRKWSASSGTTLTVSLNEGVPIRSPQDVLDKMIGDLAFDPMDFSRQCEKKPMEAVEILRKMVGIDFTKLDAEREKLYAERTGVSRDHVAVKGKLAGYVHHPDLPSAEYSLTDLNEWLQKANVHNLGRTSLDEEMNAANRAVKDHDAAVEKATAERARLLQLIEIEDLKLTALGKTKSIILEAYKKAEQKIKDFTPQDTAPIIEKITQIDEKNAKIRSNKRRTELKGEEESHSKKYDDLTEKIEAIDKQKQDQLAQAKFPIPEISFNDSGVLLAGKPFPQGSTAERIRASVAIGLALNPTLRVMIIRDGSLLDDSSLAIVKEMAEKSDAQVWIERVGHGKECDVIIQDGKLLE